MKKALFISTLLLSSGLLAYGQTETEPNNNTTTANILALNTDISGTIGDCSPLDPSFDYFKITPTSEGVMRVHVNFSNDDVSTSNVTVQLLTSSSGLDQDMTFQSGGNNIPIASQYDIFCQGIGTYYIRVHNPSSSYCTAYTLSYEMIDPIFGADPEPNDNMTQAVIVLQGVDQDGRHDFQYQSNVYDYYRLDLLNDGVLNVNISAEHADNTLGEILTMQLLNSGGGVLSTFDVPVGANGSAPASSFTFDCAGDDAHYFLRFGAFTSCGVSYRFSYSTSAPVYSQESEPNNNSAQAVVVSMGVQQEGRIGFNYEDETYDYYELNPTSDGILNIQFEAEHVDPSSTHLVTLDLLHISNGLLNSWDVPIGANSIPIASLISTECLGDDGIYFFRVQNDNSWCGVSYKFSYFSTTPLYASDFEPNDNSAQALNLPYNTNMQGRLGFYYEDETYDYYVLSIPDDGILNLSVSAEHSNATAGDLLTINLMNQSNGVLETWDAAIGANGIPSSTIVHRNCLGTEGLYYVRLFNSGPWCGVSYQISYNITPPLFGDDVEPNDNTVQAQIIDLEMASVSGRMQFLYNIETYDYFRVDLSVADNITINSEAEHAGGTPDDIAIELLNSGGGLLGSSTLPVGANSTPLVGFYQSALLTVGTYYLRLSGAPCGTSYQFDCNDDDSDGSCDGLDICQNGPEPGTPCDDLDDCTTGDVVQANCACLGIFQDSDNDGTCDADDVCPGGPEPGTACDDNDPSTSGDVIQPNCICEGTQMTDCNGDPGGTAFIDNCGVCAGGNTGNVPNADEDCLGVCFGTAVNDCNGDCDGTAFIDNCGDCVGGNTGMTPCTTDCNGDPGGSAAIDNCGICAGGNTGNIPNADEDCNGDCFGTAAIDNCGVCAGGLSGNVPNADEDCLGVCFGTAVNDCAGVCDGTAAFDNCGVCAGGTTGNVPNADEDCEGTCYGTVVPGAPCDDGDPNTSGETIQSDCTCGGGALNVINVCKRIDASSDDAEEDISDGSVAFNSSDLEMVEDGNNHQVVGLRFIDLNIPQGSTIISATVQFTADESNNVNPCQLDIYGEANNDPLTFTNSTGDISNRPQTSSSVSWSPPNWLAIGDAGAAQETPDISSIIQEVVDQSGFSNNSAIGIIIEGTGTRWAESYEGNAAAAAELCISYSVSYDCPGLQADIGDPCDDGDPNTTADEIQNDCSCSGTIVGCPGEDLTFHLRCDADPDQTTWQIIPIGGGPPVCSGGPYTLGTWVHVSCCVPDGCYRLEVLDSFGDGMGAPFAGLPGGYTLVDENDRLILDNSYNTAGFTFISAIANNAGFCVPIGQDKILSSLGNQGLCNNQGLTNDDYLIAQPNPAVIPSNGDGYQFWIFDPNGSYSRRVFQSGTINNGWSNSDPNDACYLRFGWLQTAPIPTGLYMNARVRAKISGMYNEFGPTCMIRITDTPGNNCFDTQLVDDPMNQGHSCGQVFEFGGSDKVVANPVSSANKYQFRFVNSDIGYVRQIGSANYARLLNWFTQPLQDGITYDVTVRASFDNGVNYCAYGPVCQITIANTPNTNGRSISDLRERPVLNIWPNPHREGPLYLSLGDLPSAEIEVQLDLIDKFGKRIMTKTFAANRGSLNATLDLNDLAAGMYVLSIVAGEDHFTETIMIQ